MLTIPQYLETILAQTLDTPAETDAVSLSALLYFQHQDWERARTMFNLINNPDAQVYSYLGICASSLGDVTDACQMFKLACEADPTNVLDLVRYGDVLAKSGDIDKAAAMYEGAVYLQSDFTEAYAHLVELYFSREDLDLALTTAERGLKECKDGLSILYNLQGITLAELDRLDDAALAFAYAASCNELDYNAWFNLGLTLIKLGRQEESDLALGRIPATILERYLAGTKPENVQNSIEDSAVGEAFTETSPDACSISNPSACSVEVVTPEVVA